MNIVSIVAKTNTGELFDLPIADIGKYGSQGNVKKGSLAKGGDISLIESNIQELENGQIQLSKYTSSRAFVGTPVAVLGYDSTGRVVSYPLTTNNTPQAPSQTQEVSFNFNGTPQTIPIFTEQGLGDSDLKRFPTGNYSLGGNNPFFKLELHQGSFNIIQLSNSDGYRIGGKMVLSYNMTTGEQTIGGTTNPTTNIQNIKTDQVQFNTAITPTPSEVGRLTWNDTDGTLEFGMKGGNVTQQIGQELPILVKHADNSGLAEGKVVYVVGSDGSNKTVRYAKADAQSTSEKTFGVMTEGATGGNKAFCTTFGLVRSINTSTLTEGSAVYVSPTTAGELTSTKPLAPNHMVAVGFCVRSHATQGSIFVSIHNGFEIKEIHDIAIGTLADKNLLSYEASTSLWKNKTFAELGIVSGSGTTNYVTKWNGTALANSAIYNSGIYTGIRMDTPTYVIDILTSGYNGLNISGYQSNNFINLNNILSTNNRSFRLIAGIDNVGYNGFSILDTYANATRFVIDNNGNVGIGTTSPTAKLSIEGDVHLGYPASDRFMGIYYASNYRNGLTFNGTNRSVGLISQSGDATDYIWFGTNSASERMRITNNGNVGIGTTSPSQKLDVVGNVILSGSSTSISFVRTSGTNIGGVGWYDDVFYLGGHPSYNAGAGNIVRLFGFGDRISLGNANSGDVLNIGQDGRVGIGTYSPTDLLHINGTSRTTNLKITNGATVGYVWQCTNADGSGAWTTTLASERYKGEYDASSGTAPSATPIAGDYYRVNNGGTYLGITYVAGDDIYYNGTAWAKRSNYLTLPIATSSILGGIKIGSNLSIDGSGVVTVASSPILTTARTIAASGDATWSVSFNGSADVTSALTLATVTQASSGDFRKFTLDTKGRVIGNTVVTASDVLDTIGVLPIANGGTGSATQNFVDLTTTQSSIGGQKTFTSRLTINNRVYQTGLGGSTYFGYLTGSGDDLSTRQNTAFGYGALWPLTTGSKNTAIGYYAGSFNLASEGMFASTNSVFVGYGTKPSGDSNTNEIVIGYNSVGYGSNTATFGNSNTVATHTFGTLKYDTLLKPNNIAGISGQFLGTSGTQDVWTTLTTSHISNLSSYEGFDSRYFTETEADARFQPLDADLTAIAALAGTSGLLKKTAANTWTLDTSTYLTSVNLATNVTGVLPIANGGTGSSTQNFVDLTTTQSVAGNKTFTGTTYIGTGSMSLSASAFGGTIASSGIQLILSSGTYLKATVSAGDRFGVYDAGVRIGTTSLSGITAPTERLQVDGNIRYNTLLKPNNVAGTNKQVLSTNGTQDAWVSLDASYISGLVSNLDSLSDVVITSATTSNVLQYDGTNWVNLTADNAGLVDRFNNQSIAGNKTFSGSTTLSGSTTIISGFTRIGGSYGFRLNTAQTYNGKTNVNTLFNGDISVGVYAQMKLDASDYMFSKGNIKIGGAYSGAIGTIEWATEKLDIDGNIRLSGSIKPDNVAPTAGYFLKGVDADNMTWAALTTSDVYNLDTILSGKQDALNGGTGLVYSAGGSIGYINGTQGQILTKDSSGNMNFMDLEIAPYGISHERIGVGDYRNYLSEHNNFLFKEKRYIDISRITDSTKHLSIGMLSKSNNAFISHTGGSLSISATGGVVLPDFATSSTALRMLTIDATGRLSTSTITSGGGIISDIQSVLTAGDVVTDRSIIFKSTSTVAISLRDSSNAINASFTNGSQVTLSSNTKALEINGDTGLYLYANTGSINIGYSDTLKNIHLNGMPFNFNEDSLYQGANKWGLLSNASSPQTGDMIVQIYDGSRFVPIKVRSHSVDLGAGTRDYFYIDNI